MREEYEKVCNVLKGLLEENNSVLFKAPPAFGKTLLTARLCKELKGRAVFVARTINEVKVFEGYLKREGVTFLSILGLPNLCLEESVASLDFPENFKACREERRKGVCKYFARFRGLGSRLADFLAERADHLGVDDLVRIGSQEGVCPFFLSRYLGRYKKFKVVNTTYMGFSLTLTTIPKGALIIFDEAHTLPEAIARGFTKVIDREALTRARLEANSRVARGLISKLRSAVEHRSEEELEEIVKASGWRKLEAFWEFFGLRKAVERESYRFGYGFLVFAWRDFGVIESHKRLLLTATSTPSIESLAEKILEVEYRRDLKCRIYPISMRYADREKNLDTAVRIASYWIGRARKSAIVFTTSKGMRRAVLNRLKGMLGRVENVNGKYFKGVFDGKTVYLDVFGGTISEGVDIDADIGVLIGFPEPPPSKVPKPDDIALDLVFEGLGIEEDIKAYKAEVSFLQALGRVGRHGEGTAILIDDRYLDYETYLREYIAKTVTIANKQVKDHQRIQANTKDYLQSSWY